MMNNFDYENIDVSDWRRIDLEVMSYFGIEGDSKLVCLNFDEDEWCKDRLAIFLDWENKVHYVVSRSDDDELEEERFIRELSYDDAINSLRKFVKMSEEFIKIFL